MRSKRTFEEHFRLIAKNGQILLAEDEDEQRDGHLLAKAESLKNNLTERFNLLS